MNLRFRDNWLWYILIILLLASNVYLFIGRYSARKELTDAVKNERLHSVEKEQAAILQHLEGTLNQDMLLYSDMIRNDLNNEKWKPIRALFQRIVSLTNAKSLEVIDKSGKVVVSFDKKQEGRSKSTVYDSRILFDDLNVHHQHLPIETISSLRLMQDTTFLGYLVMHYSDQTVNVSPH